MHLTLHTDQVLYKCSTSVTSVLQVLQVLYKVLYKVF